MNKKKLGLIIIVFICVIAITTGIVLGPNDKQTNNTINNTINNTTENTVIVTNETKDIVNNTIESVKNGEDLSTKELIKSNEQEEQNVTDESALETDASVEQENISYDGDNTGNGMSLLGPYQGLTYYSQADPRWANDMYSSVNKSSQTMKSSACGPTSAAMGWSSILIMGNNEIIMNAGSYSNDHSTTSNTYDVWVKYTK